MAQACDSSIREVEVTEPEVQGHPLVPSLKPASARDAHQSKTGRPDKETHLRCGQVHGSGNGEKGIQQGAGKQGFEISERSPPLKGRPETLHGGGPQERADTPPLWSGEQEGTSLDEPQNQHRKKWKAEQVTPSSKGKFSLSII